MKKCIKAMALAAVLIAMPVAAFAAGSKTYSDNSDSTSTTSNSFSGGVTSVGTITAGSGQVVQSGQTVTSSQTTTNSQVIVNEDGSKTEVIHVTSNDQGNYTGLVKAESDTDVALATGAAKTAGLPAETVSIINQIDAGNLSAVQEVDTAGKTGYGVSAAVRAEEGNKLVTLYVSDLPSGITTTEILFYNNATGRWSKLIGTVSVDGKKVTFIAPYSGTAKVMH